MNSSSLPVCSTYCVDMPIWHNMLYIVSVREEEKMESRIAKLEERLRALSGALRLRGVWPEPDPVEAEAAAEIPPGQVLRLRSREIAKTAD